MNQQPESTTIVKKRKRGKKWGVKALALYGGA